MSGTNNIVPGKLTFSLFVGLVAPYTASIDPYVEALAAGKATASITQRSVHVIVVRSNSDDAIHRPWHGNPFNRSEHPRAYVYLSPHSSHCSIHAVALANLGCAKLITAISQS